MKTYEKPSKPLEQWTEREVLRDARQRVKDCGKQYRNGAASVGFYEFDGRRFRTKAELAPEVIKKWREDWQASRLFAIDNNLPLSAGKIKAVKLSAGRYRVGKIVIVRHDPPPGKYGQATTWKNEATMETLGYTLGDIRRLVNDITESKVYALARGLEWIAGKKAGLE